MNSAPTDPLAALKDIHLPPPVSAWPPAPGWWILAALLLIALIGGWWWLSSRRRRHAYRRAALRELTGLQQQWQRDGDREQLQAGINRLLKQIALAAYPRAQVAALHGDAWLQFLDAQVKKPLFAPLQGFASPYSAHADMAEPAALIDAARAWIRRHRC